MDVREKLVELIKEGIRKGLRAMGDDRLDYSFEDVADYLISNGVTVQGGKPLEAFLHPVDAYKGLKAKYLVFKADTGERVENCFVLRPDKDPASVEALRAYASATDNETLAKDIYNWVGKGVTVQEWISVKDMLPKNEKSVLTFVGYEESMIGFITVSSYFCFETNPHWQWDGLLKDEQKTLFWMPLPGTSERRMIMSKKLPDLTGEHFGRWTVIEYAGRGNHGEVQYKCRCDCGTERIIRRTSLTSGNSRSCGCLSRDTAKERGITHGDSKIRLYRIWAGIIQRCCNDRERYEWEKYGGRGINVCTEWHKYEAFRDWALSNGYNDELTIDRIDVNGDYCPNNCRWATAYEQNNNKRTSKYISFNGKTGTVREFADKYGLAYSCLYERLKLGWSIEKALLTPSRKVVKA